MGYKLSRFTVITDSVNEKNQRVVFATHKGKRCIITEPCYQALIGDTIDIIPESIQQQLFEKGVIVDAAEDELAAVVKENIDFSKERTGNLYEIIQPSANCQLGCYYCGQDHKKHNASQLIIDKIVERIEYKFNDGDYDGVDLGWFGGEPLMGLQQMRKIDSQLRERLGPDVEVNGRMVSNGLSLKKNIFLEMVEKFNMKSIEITLDGIKEHHDTHRYTKTGLASFDLIYKNLKDIFSIPNFHEMGCDIVIRCNVDENNVDGIEPLIYKFVEDGMHTYIKRLYFVGIYSWGGNDAHKKALTKELFAMKKLKWDMLKMKLGFNRPQKTFSRKKSTCIATGGASEMYDAYGNVFNCTEISFVDQYKETTYDLGNLKSMPPSFEMENKPHNDWYKKVEKTDEFPCHSCPVFPICGGACPKSWEEGNPACPPFKFNLRKEMELDYILLKTPKEEMAEALLDFESSLSIEQFKRIGT